MHSNGPPCDAAAHDAAATPLDARCGYALRSIYTNGNGSESENFLCLSFFLWSFSLPICSFSLSLPILFGVTRALTRGVLVFLKFGQFSSELTKTWSSGATECGVWIGNCNAKVWKSTEHKLHKIWGVLVLLKFWVNSQKLGVQAPQNVEFE